MVLVRIPVFGYELVFRMPEKDYDFDSFAFGDPWQLLHNDSPTVGIPFFTGPWYKNTVFVRQ